MIQEAKFRLISEDLTYEVTSFRMLTKRDDDNIHPISEAKTDFVEITIPTAKKPTDIINWYTHNLKQDAEVTMSFAPTGLSGMMIRRTIKYTGAQCFSVEEVYHLDKTQRMFTLLIAAGKVSFKEEKVSCLGN